MFDAALCQTIHGQPLQPLFWPAVADQPPTRQPRLWRRYRVQLSVTWLLFIAENLCRLALPLELAAATDGMLDGSAGGLVRLALVQAAFVGLGAVRRMYDTRTFARAKADLAATLVARQSAQGVAPTQLVARTALLEELLEFVERDVPLAVQTLCTLLVVVGILGCTQPVLALGCLVLLVLSLAANRFTISSVQRLSRVLHDRAEESARVIEQGTARQTAAHFQSLAGLQIRLSDRQAWGFGLGEALAASLLTFSVWYLARDPQTSPGDLLGNLRYLLLFSASACSAPLLLQQVERLRDIVRRVGHDLV